MKKNQLFALAGVLVVLAVALFLLPTPGEPDLVCVANNAPSSGFVNEDKVDCPISTESFNEHTDWESKPKLDNIAGLVLIIGAIGAAGVGAFRMTKPDS